MVAEDKGAVYIPPGQILRDCVAQVGGHRHHFNFDLRRLSADMKQAKLVDGVVLAQGVVSLVRAELEGGKRRFVFTGWPREDASLNLLDDLVVDLLSKDVRVDARHVYLKANEDERRRRHQAGLHSDKVRGRKPREDDTPEGFASRDFVFQNRTLPFLLTNWKRLNVIPVDSCATTRQTQEGVIRALGIAPKSQVEGQLSLPAQARR